MNIITFLAPSGSPASGTIIQQLIPPGNTSGANFIGFFGTGGPQGTPFAVIVDRYQDKTYITNMSGSNLGSSPFGLRGSGQLLNAKFLSANTASLNGFPSVTVGNVPAASGTVLIRFNASGVSSVRTQNALLRCVVLNSTSGVDDVTSVVTGLKVQAFEPVNDAVWTQLAGVAATDNKVNFDDQNTNANVHDFFVCLSASPETVGQRNNFGFFMILEFL